MPNDDLRRTRNWYSLALPIAALATAAVCLLSSRALADEPAVASTVEQPLSIDAAAIDSLIDRALARGKLPGISVAVVLEDEIVWSGAAGLADLENDVPATPQTVYRIGSISKPIAAVAVMQLVEQGKVSLDDPIQKYVPSFPEKEQGTVTVRHLMTHTAGVRHYKSGEFLSRRRFENMADAINIFKDDPLLFAPGDKFSYSSYGYNLLAGVVEVASGQPFDVYLQEHIFAPAGMTSASCERAEQLVPHRARSYERDEAGNLENAPYVDLSIKWAGGGLIASVEDLAHFDIALRQGKLLKPETMEAMYAPAKLADGSKAEYGLGWRVTREALGRRIVAHSGGSTGATTHLHRWPDENLAVVVLVNVSPTPVPRPLAERIARLVAGELPAPAPAE